MLWNRFTLYDHLREIRKGRDFRNWTVILSTRLDKTEMKVEVLMGKVSGLEVSIP